jgi:plastocyanin
MKEHRVSKLSRRTLVLAASSVPAVAIAFGVRAAQDGLSTPDASPEASPMASPQASPMASPTGGSAVQLNALDIDWEPKELTIPADTDVPITVVNTGVLQHNFAVDELNIESDLLNGGERTDVVVNAPAGSYEFYCAVPGHKEAGMVGTLTVE